MKIARTAIVAVAAPSSLSATDLAFIEGGDALLDQIGKERLDYFEQNKPKNGQSRDSYAKQTEKKSDYDRWSADRYWDAWAKQPETKPGNVT
jgi:hypothetical protein